MHLSTQFHVVTSVRCTVTTLGSTDDENGSEEACGKEGDVSCGTEESRAFFRSVSHRFCSSKNKMTGVLPFW